MAKPTTREELKDYCLRQLGAPVLESNVVMENDLSIDGTLTAGLIDGGIY